jgi:hypothetical protein
VAKTHATPEQRRLIGLKGAYALHAAGKTNTGPARQVFEQRWDDQVDPDRQLDSVERARRAEYARKAYYVDLALQSAKARRARATRPRPARRARQSEGELPPAV